MTKHYCDRCGKEMPTGLFNTIEVDEDYQVNGVTMPKEIDLCYQCMCEFFEFIGVDFFKRNKEMEEGLKKRL